MLLLLAVMAYTASLWSEYAKLQSLSLIAFSLFALAIILGMMGKIVPFLVWFHLNSAGYMDAPIMSNIIPQSRAKWIFTLFIFTSISSIVGVFYIELFALAALIATAMFTLLLMNLINAYKLYRYTLSHGKRFEQG